jgi:5-deoxy-glucuronate isomerase
MTTDWVLRSGSFDRVTPETAGWRFLSFSTVSMDPGGSLRVGRDGHEYAVVILSGQAKATVGGEEWTLEGRVNLFESLPWAVYCPADETVEMTSEMGGELAICGARADPGPPPRLITPDDVEVEIRGAGSATRQINHILAPTFPAHRLLVVEVFTPGGNWSSYPPHKHDVDHPPDEVELEEFYYFRVRPNDGFGFVRVYSPRHGTDLTAAVHEGDVVLVPHGYHVTGAPHAIDLYYLNGLAGDARSMAATDDEHLAWIRDSWSGMDPDPRLPMTRLEESGT